MAKVTIIPSKLNPITQLPNNALYKRKVAAYARVSTLQDEQLSSYDAQVDYYKKYIADKPEWEYVGIYSDKGISGTNRKNRAGFNQMIADALNGKIDLIITKSVTRFARNTLDTISVTRELKSHGVEVFFEEQNVYTFDSSGELMLTIMASIAQEESRNISENVKWGKRKKYNDGIASLAYKHFLGYDKHPTDPKKGFVINEEQAEIVRLIYKLFMKGKKLTYIAKFLEDNGYKTPMGKDKWRISTLESILRNEKYKGDALICKTYVKDFLEHKLVKNNGEVDQVYVEGHHDPIIEPHQWELVQVELDRRKNLSLGYKCKSIFSSKLICSHCGSFYGQKVWHSTSKYRRLVYQCNDKFNKNHSKCQTPTLNEEDVITKFLNAYTTFMGDKGKVISNCRDMIKILDNSSELENEIEHLKIRSNEIIILVQNLIDRNSTEPMSQEEYQAKYDEYDKEYAEIINKVNELEDEIRNKKAQAKNLNAFIADLANRPNVLSEWDEDVWNYLVEKATVHEDKTITFLFRNGQEINVK